MEITDAVINRSVVQKPFGTFEPFITGGDREAASFFSSVLSALEQVSGMSVFREIDHHGSGYASYISTFLFPSDGRSRRDFPDYVQTGGILLYLSRLAPIAVYGASFRNENKSTKSSSSGFIGANNVGTVPDGDWTEFLASVANCLRSFRIEVLQRDPLLRPAPEGIAIPTVFDGPYYVFDTLFYWAD